MPFASYVRYARSIYYFVVIVVVVVVFISLHIMYLVRVVTDDDCLPDEGTRGR